MISKTDSTKQIAAIMQSNAPRNRADLLKMIEGAIDRPNSFAEVAIEVLTRIELAGLVIVPAEETEAMLDAALAAEVTGGDIWKAKLQASPFCEAANGYDPDIENYIDDALAAMREIAEDWEDEALALRNLTQAVVKRYRQAQREAISRIADEE